MKTITAKTPLLIFSLTLAIVAGCLYAYLNSAIGSAFVKAGLARSVISSQRQDSAQALDILALYNRTAADRAKLTSFFIPDSQAVSFIENLEQLGPVVGSTVTLSNVTADDTSSMKAGSFAHVSAHIDVTGPWSSVLRTLMLSELLPYESSVSNVSLNSSYVGTGKDMKRQWRATYDVTATVFVSASSTKP